MININNNIEKKFLTICLPDAAYKILKEYFNSKETTIESKLLKTKENYEKCLYILHKIYCSFLLNNSKYYIKGKNLPFEIIRTELNLFNDKFKAAIKLLVDLGLILKKHSYIKDAKLSNSYCFTQAIELNQKPQYLILSISKTKRNKINLKDWKIKIIQKKEFEKSIMIDFQKANFEFIELTEQGKQYLILKGFDLDLSFIDFVQQSEGVCFNNQDFLLYKIAKKQFDFLRKEGERLYSNLTNLNREFKHLLMFCGNPIVEVDISNSQILFGALELKSTFKNKNYKDFELFYSECLKGTFYEYLAGVANQTELLKNNRSFFKKKFLEIWFGANEKNKCSSNVLRESFIIEFPNVFEAIQQLKKENKADWAILLQKLEANLILDCVGKDLIADGIPFLTIHDSFVVSSIADAKQVIKAIKENFKNKKFDIPTIKAPKIIDLYNYQKVIENIEQRKIEEKEIERLKHVESGKKAAQTKKYNKNAPAKVIKLDLKYPDGYKQNKEQIKKQTEMKKENNTNEKNIKFDLDNFGEYSTTELIKIIDSYSNGFKILSDASSIYVDSENYNNTKDLFEEISKKITKNQILYKTLKTLSKQLKAA